jgi:cation diffusion facilitator family transporter
MKAREKTQNKTADIRLAATIALVGNAVLAALKIYAGLASGSSALFGDGVDSSADVLISVVTLAIVRVISKPADAGHPWGHGRAETVMTAFMSFALFFMGAQVIAGAVSSLISGPQDAAPPFFAVAVTLASIAGKIMLAGCQYALGKRAGSAMLMANAKNMAGDVLISLGVLLGLWVSGATGTSYADTVIAGIIGCWIIRTAVGIFLEANLELMDGSRDTQPYRVVIDAVNAVEGASNPHRARMRRVAGFWDIDFDIDVDPECTVTQAHDLACKVEDEIKRRLDNVFDIMIHVEPGGEHANESFGLTEEMIGEDNQIYNKQTGGKP